MAESEMKNQPISPEDADALLRGAVPPQRDDLESLVRVMASVRSDATTGVVTPSAALSAWFEAPDVSGTPDAELSRVIARSSTRGAAPTHRRRWAVQGWIAGLGIVAKIAIGSGVAAASVVGAGAAAVLPPAAQDVFDGIVTAVAPLEREPISDDVVTGDIDDTASGVEPGAESSAPLRALEARARGQEQAAAAHERAEAREDVRQNPEAAGNESTPPGAGVPGTPANPGNGNPNPGRPESPGNATPGAPASPDNGKPAPGNGNGNGNGNPAPGKPDAPGTPASPGNGKPNPGNGTPATPQTPGNAGEAGPPADTPGKGRP
jgi:hypothetical protein